MSTFHKELYSDMILKIKCGSYHGQTIKAKPILLYAVICMVEKGLVKDNRIFFNKSTEEFYKNVFIFYGFSITPFFKPFYYLQFDGFWHLKAKNDNLKAERISSKYIRDNIEYAYLDNALWDLLQDASIRAYYKSIIESYHLKKED